MAICIAHVFYFVYFRPVKQNVNYSLQIFVKGKGLH